MNTFQRNLRDQAAAEAKRANSATIEEVHAAAALAMTLQDPALSELRAQARTSSLQSASTAGITSEAEDLISRTVDEASARDALLAYLGGVAMGSGGVAETATAPEPSAEPETQLHQTGDASVSVEALLRELDALVGLAEVKKQVHRFLAVHQANVTRESEGLPKVPLSLHIVFSGNPGTGKTTVARIVGRLYQAAGLLPSGHLVETDRSGLVAGYVGQTAIKVQEIIQRADGGVLFIDEAYALASDAREDFGQEAVSALVKAMEDRRETLAVIAAGYEEPMEGFISMNQGLRSRFQTFVSFPDYTPEQMTEIFSRLGQQHEIGVTRVLPIVKSLFATTNVDSEAGNGRLVRSLFEQMYANLAVRAAADGKIEAHEIQEFEPEDVPEARTPNEKPRIGFI